MVVKCKKSNGYMSFFLVVLCTLALFVPCSLQDTELKIGLLSHKGLEKVEIAFNYAIDNINEDMEVLPTTKLVGVITQMESAEESPAYIIKNTIDLVNKKVSAVIGPFRSSHAQIASYVLSALHIPMITPTSTDPFLRNPLWSEYMLHMQPLDKYQSLALLEICSFMKWSSVALISSMDQYGINGLTTFQRLSNERKIKILANEMVPLTKDLMQIDVSQQVLNLKASEARIFIMNVHSGYAQPILEAAEAAGIVGPDYAWVVTDGTVKDAENLLNGTAKEFGPSVQGMVGLMSSGCCSQTKKDIIKKWETMYGVSSTAGAESLAGVGGNTELQSRASLTYDSVTVVALALHKLIHDDFQLVDPPKTVDFWSTPIKYYDSGQRLLNQMLKTSFTDGLTGTVSFDRDGGPISKSYDLVNFRRKGIVKVGEWRPPPRGLTWSKTEPIKWNGDEKPSSAIKSLEGRKLRLGITQEPPFIQIDFNCTAIDRTNRECYTGLCIDLIDKLAQILNFDYEFIESEDKKFGAPMETVNGTQWNGLIKMLLAGKIDVGAVNFAMNKARESAIDFSMPFINTGLVMTTKIKESKSDPFFWTKPFDVDLWYAILAFAVLMVLLIWLYDHMSPFGYYGRRMHAALRCSCKECERFRCNKEQCTSEDEDSCLYETRLADPSENQEELMNVGNSLWMVVACLFSIGPVEGVPRNMSGRVILAMWWFMILIVTAMYTANLAAFLTVTRMENGINSISDLIKQDKVKWGTVTGTNAEILLSNANSPELVEVYSRMERVSSVEDGFDRARNDEYIFFYGGAIVAFEANTKPCNLQIIGEQLFSFGYAFGFPPNSPYLESFNAALLNLSEQNELDSLWKKWSKGECVAKGTPTTSSSLNLANIYGLCYTFFVVIAVSTIILLGEIIYESIMDMKRFKTSFLNSLKYRFIYIWKRPEYQNCQYQELNDSANKKPSDKTELIQMVQVDKKDMSVKKKEEEVEEEVEEGEDEKRVVVDGRMINPTPYYHLQYPPYVEDEKHSLPRQPNGYNLYTPPHKPYMQPRGMIIPPMEDEIYLPSNHNPYHRSLPLDYSPAGSDLSHLNLYPSISRPKNRPKASKQVSVPGSKGTPKQQQQKQPPQQQLPPHHFEELFDRTLERITSNNTDSGGEPPPKAKRINPNSKGASLSTRSSVIYSSPDAVSDTDELPSESEVSLPP